MQSVAAEELKKRFLSSDALQDQQLVIENCHARLPNSGFAFAADFFEQLDLNLLNFEEPIVLAP